jgi:hypothetical protein
MRLPASTAGPTKTVSKPFVQADAVQASRTSAGTY